MVKIMSPIGKSTKTTQLRRNERERKRVHQVNHGFEHLRQHVPKALANKKMSKADTLKEAVKYIQQLQDILNYSQPPQQQVNYQSSCSQQGFYEMDVMFYQQSQNVSVSPTSSSASSSSHSHHISPPHVNINEQHYQQHYQYGMHTSP